MINYSEENAVKLSATKKDFYQIWNELLETASKISERWDPTSTNESDPGIVLLKVLTAVADKLNYNIDVNALEAFMPSAAQEESMRKLTEMLGYNMKYYRSATTTALITYNKSETEAIKAPVCIDRFTNLKDIDETINYVTLRTVYLNQDNSSVLVDCIEGELVECETENDNIISLMQLDDNNRYYLPEVQIAENGLFVTNIDNGSESEEWAKVNNLNTQPVQSKCFKFGFDSKVNLPYIQFPDDISNLIEDGLKIKYLRTNGINGNISAKTLYKMEKPASWQVQAEDTESTANTAAYFDVNNYVISNTAAAINGANIESLTDAYNNYKKTIGTFDTLVTCRDYMNKIYQMTVNENSTTGLVSNIVVSDIRDDINKANTICTFGKYGVEYNNVAKKLDLQSATPVTKNEWETDYVPHTEDMAKTYLNTLFKVYELIDGAEKVYGYYRAVFDGNYYTFVEVNTDELTHFDLVFYPFKNTYGTNSKLEYTKSFKYDDSNLLEIKEQLEDNKTLSHNIITPNQDDIACIKNYFNLDAKVTTTRKVNYVEQKAILANIYSKLYENFNMRKVDFGEEIPYDDILRVMETADPRIKNVSLEDPTLVTKFCAVDGGEFSFSSKSDVETGGLKQVGNYYYNKLVLNNVLAGRIPLFNYDENFKPEYNEKKYPAWGSGTTEQYDLLYPNTIEQDKSNGISKLVSEFIVDLNNTNLKLKQNEVIQFRMPNLRTIKTYPAYVNYFLQLTPNSRAQKAIPATMQTLKTFLDSRTNSENSVTICYWDLAVNSDELAGARQVYDGTINNQATLSSAIGDKAAIFIEDSTNHYVSITTWKEEYLGASFYYLKFDDETFNSWNTWLKSLIPGSSAATLYSTLNGLYRVSGQSSDYNWGKYVDTQYRKYKPAGFYSTSPEPFEAYYVQQTHPSIREPEPPYSAEDCYTQDGLGRDATIVGIAANTEYELKQDEYLLINYTSSTATSGDTKTIINEAYREGDIIKPNFELVDSKEYRTLHKYTKVSGYGPFTLTPGQSVTPPGMFTLGTNEQIELRDFVQVHLDKDYTNIYWERNDEVIGANDRIVFNFDEEYVNKNTGEPCDSQDQDAIPTAYTLKDGEYFYYTNRDKLDIAYYGAGTKIKKTIYTPQIYKSKFDNEISAEEIATKGLSAAIPWRPYSFGNAGHNKELVLTEYQYITLAEGSTLVSCELEDDVTATTLSNNWVGCKDTTTYKINDEGAQTLPPVDFTTHDIKWEVRSKLEMNMGPNLIQQLYETNDGKTYDSITLYTHETGTDTLLETIRPHNGNTLAIKANKLIQSTADTIITGYTDIADTGSTATYYDCQLKIFELNDLRDINNTELNINNFGDGLYTKINFANMDAEAIEGKPFTQLQTIVPEHRFGLFMIQNNRIGAGKTAAIRMIPSTSQPVICNNLNSNGQEIWWNTGKDGGETESGVGIFAVEGTSYPGITAEEFNKLKNDLYVKTEVPLPGSGYTYALHTLENGPDGFLHYYEYIKATEYITGAYYCRLLDEGTDDGTLYHLRKGINVVKINPGEGGILQIFADQTNEDVIIISPLDLVYDGDTAINPKLCYKKIDEDTAYEQIMHDILILDPDHQFYYNALMNNETALDLNANDPNDTLENPLNWYNYNNMNNKFVISEINADYLNTGITIARNSKL